MCILYTLLLIIRLLKNIYKYVFIGNKNEHDYEEHDVNKSKIETVADNSDVSKSFGLRRPVASGSG